MSQPDSPATVVKIGGSLYGTERLDRIVAGVLAAPVPVVIVPGGGPFADAVRDAQKRLGFDDRLAHRLALDAMAQAAEALAARHTRLTVADLPQIGEAHHAGRVPIWQPRILRAGHPDIAESWSVTSDSLALWLARTLEAARIVLVKSIDVVPGASPAALSAAAVVDAAFPDFAACFNGEIVVAGPASDERLAALIGGGVPQGAQAG